MAEVISLGAEPLMDAISAMHEADEPEQPEHAAFRAQARGLIEAKIDGLPEVFRTVFILRAVEELSVEETAGVLEIPEATVRSRFFRARGMLREALAREIDFALEDAFGFDGERCDRIVDGVMRRLRERGED
jgi:RNA polymerase sigma-70 factor (ECF subfamily)